MGYRAYIGKIKKEKYNQLKQMTIEELKEKYKEDGNEYLSILDLPIKEIYEMGKNVSITDFTNLNFFDTFDWNEYDGDTELYLGSKATFEKIINSYKEKILNYYKEMKDVEKNIETLKTKLNDTSLTEKEDLEDLKYELYKKEEITIEKKNYWRLKVNEWGSSNNILDMSTIEQITSSWLYEYSVFNLMHLYKIFDWENDVMIMYAY